MGKARGVYTHYTEASAPSAKDPIAMPRSAELRHNRSESIDQAEAYRAVKITAYLSHPGAHYPACCEEVIYSILTKEELINIIEPDQPDPAVGRLPGADGADDAGNAQLA